MRGRKNEDYSNCIERCGLNEITVNASNLKTLKLLSSIGFNKISKINDKIGIQRDNSFGTECKFIRQGT